VSISTPVVPATKLTHMHRQCDDLEDDLLFDLDDAAKRIQMSRRPSYARWQLEQLDAELHQKYPDLDDRIAQERQSKIDSIMLPNKYAESLPKGVSSFRAGSFKQLNTESVPKQPKRRPSHQGSLSPSSTPVLKGRNQPSELIFDMDDEKELSPLLSSAKAPELPEISMHETDSFSTPSKRKIGKQRASVPQEAFVNKDFPKQSSLETTKSKTPVPWLSSTLSKPKLSMKDIMDQTSSSRSSNLTSGLSENPNTIRRASSSNPSTKISQKERKRLQHQVTPDTTTTQAPSVSPALKVSPWKTIPQPKSKAIERSSPVHATGRTTPQLTMRQTIANPGPSKERNPAEASSTPSKTPSRDTPSKATTILTPDTALPVQIKSIRHVPMPTRPSPSTQNLSMTDILSQQEAEKVLIQGGGEKRSLADIQAEQEFQQWWDQEAARVQNEERARQRREQNKTNRPNRRRGGGHKNKGQSSK
jgi:inhibitor of Bruton tyrosine kinase